MKLPEFDPRRLDVSPAPRRYFIEIETKEGPREFEVTRPQYVRYAETLGLVEWGYDLLPFGRGDFECVQIKGFVR
jgi:hypothetical protein